MGFLLFICTGFFLFHSFHFYQRCNAKSSFAESYLFVVICLTLCVLVFTEALSLFALINTASLHLLWLCIALFSFFFWWKNTDKRLRPALNGTLNFRLPVMCIVIVLLTTLLIALFAYPNNWDSMTYHLSRVMHWTQNGHVNHYATHIERQISQPPLAEYFILHFYLLSGIDRLANLVQWFFMSGTLAVVWLIAKEWKAENTTATLAVLFAVLLPMGILQSSSTQNDYVVSFFIGSSILFLLRAIALRFPLYQVIFFSISVSLACMAKGTAYIFLIPVVVVYGIYALKHFGWKVYLPLCIGVLFYAGINGAFVLRNYHTFGHPLATDITLLNEDMGMQALFSNAAKNTAMHLLTPFDNINNMVTAAVEVIHILIRVDINDKRFNWQFSPEFGSAQSTLHEDYAGNPLQLVLLVIVILLMLLRWRKEPALHMVYAAILIAMLCIFSLVLKWQVWHFRLHLPLFIIAAPLLAVFVARCKQVFQNAIVILFMFYALPFLWYN
ncbi:MAG: hypothetical protein ACK4IY_02545, partial [Chitinophagales bacterium]